MAVEITTVRKGVEGGGGGRGGVSIYQYRDPHVKDNMGIPYLGKTVFILRRGHGKHICASELGNY